MHKHFSNFSFGHKVLYFTNFAAFYLYSEYYYKTENLKGVAPLNLTTLKKIIVFQDKF